MTSYGGMGEESESLADDFRVAENETLKMDERRHCLLHWCMKMTNVQLVFLEVHRTTRAEKGSYYIDDIHTH